MNPSAQGNESLLRGVQPEFGRGRDRLDEHAGSGPVERLLQRDRRSPRRAGRHGLALAEPALRGTRPYGTHAHPYTVPASKLVPLPRQVLDEGPTDRTVSGEHHIGPAHFTHASLLLFDTPHGRPSLAEPRAEVGRSENGDTTRGG